MDHHGDGAGGLGSLPNGGGAHTLVWEGEPDELELVFVEGVGGSCRVLVDDGAYSTTGVNWAFEAIAGRTYHLVVDGTTGPFTASLRRLDPPANDDYADAQRITGHLPQTVTGTTRDQTPEPTAPWPAGVTRGADVWYEWRAPRSGPVVVDTSASPAFAGPRVFADRGGVPELVPALREECGDIAGVLLTFQAVRGTSYRIGVLGSGPLRMTLRRPAPPANGQLNHAQTLARASTADVVGTLVDATAQREEPNHGGLPPTNTVWYSWRPAQSGRVRLEICDLPVHTVLAVYTGANLRGLDRVASDPAVFFGCPAVVVDATAGETYRIAVGRDTAGFETNPVGPFTLRLRPIAANGDAGGQP